MDAGGTRTVDLDRRVLIGSSANVDVLVNDRMVSRLHVEVEPRDGGVWVRDLESTNGTWVQDLRVHSAVLPQGASLRVGSTVISISGTSEPAKIPLWPSDRMGLWLRAPR